MAHFGLLCLPVASHLTVFFTVSEELIRRGHTVTLINLPCFLDRGRVPGLAFLPLTNEEEAKAILKCFERSAYGSLAATLQGQIEFDRFYYKTVLANAPGIVENAKIDKLVCDQALICASTVAELVKLPFVSVCCGLPLNRERYVPPFFCGWKYRRTWLAAVRNRIGYGISGLASRKIAQDLNRFRKQAGLRRLRVLDDSFSPYGQISQQSEAFDYPRDARPATFHYVGPIRPRQPRDVPFPFERLTGAPLIYCTLGTTVNRQPHLFRTIAEACQPLQVQLVITLGRGCKAKDVPVMAPSQIVVDYAPQLGVLAHASLTITHAGMITSLDSLSCGVPILAIPLSFEQPAIAARIAYTGAGAVMQPKNVTVKTLRALIEEMLRVSRYRENARRLQKSLTPATGRERAVDVMEGLPG